ncbi:MAG: OmpL47-type beta-barrel domain-containing protein, partial [bacterium]
NEPLYLKYLKEGLHSLNYYSVDNVNNKENVFTWDFVMDYTPPSISMQVLGDYFKKNDIEYISSRSSLAFQVFDEIAGVSNIQYLVKGQDPEFIPYRAPFIVNGKNGVYRIQYFAIDNVNNKSELKNRSFFLDNEPPVTGINFGSKSFFSRDTLYISKNTNITLFTRDNYSGIRETFYSLNEKAPELYKGKIEIQEEGFLKIFFKSTDNVDNEEQTKVSEVYVDNSPPEIYTNFSIKAIGSKEMNGKAVDVYPNFTHLYIGANDEHSGVGNIHYSINDGPFVLYMDPYMLDVQGVSESVEENKFKIRIKAEDKLGNSKKRTIEFYVSHY